MWLPDADGVFHLTGEYGSFASVMATAPGGRIRRLTAQDGCGGEAIRHMRTVVTDRAGDPDSCLRWQAAVSAGAVQGALLPLVEGRRVVALFEYYDVRACRSSASGRRSGTSSVGW